MDKEQRIKEIRIGDKVRIKKNCKLKHLIGCKGIIVSRNNKTGYIGVESAFAQGTQKCTLNFPENEIEIIEARQINALLPQGDDEGLLTISLIYVGNDYYQTLERIPDDSPSGADYWSCYIPRVIAKKYGLEPERGCVYQLTLTTKDQRDLTTRLIKQEKLDRPELPNTLTNNIGCMSKSEIEVFADLVLRECGYSYTMKWTTAGDIVIKPFIYIDERHIDEYPYMAKERVLHEVAHIDTHPQDDRHGELFHSRLAELIEQFMGRSSYHG